MIRLTDGEFEQIVSYTKKYSGINLEKKKILIECRLKSELQKYNITSYGQYLQMIDQDSTGAMRRDMIDRLSTHYTYFMREFQHFDFIREKILPEMGEKKRAREFLIWCAGCSTGQECYTLAMLLEDYVWQGNWLPPFKIIASDLSEKALDQAKTGSYARRELEQLPAQWHKRYCAIHDDTFEIKPVIKSHIRFRKQNLLSPALESEQFDLVMCRNVMIYFDTDAKKTLIHNLEHSLKPGGYLLVGHAELLQRDYTRLLPVASAAYRKE